MDWAIAGLVFDLAVLGVLLAPGYFRWRAAEAKNGSKSEPPRPSPSLSSENGDWIDDLPSKIGREVDCRHDRIEQIGVALRETTPASADEMVMSVARLVLAFRQLQQDLARAWKEIRRQRQEVSCLSAEARIDLLTGLPNRRSFTEALARCLDQWDRCQVPLSLLMIDIDKFKRVNDEHGHQTGDEVLRSIAKILLTTLRPMDIAARFGGEEFVVLLPGTQLQEATKVAERLRATAMTENVVHGGKHLGVTVSIGVSSVCDLDDAESLIRRADEALYAAKKSGRNRACMHDRNSVAPIALDESVVRKPFHEQQLIAPYHGHGLLPGANEFRAVRCHDLSPRGLSFFCDEPPSFGKFVVRLTKNSETTYVLAQVAHVADIGHPKQPRYLVGCAFLRRLHREEQPGK